MVAKRKPEKIAAGVKAGGPVGCVETVCVDQDYASREPTAEFLRPGSAPPLGPCCRDRACYTGESVGGR